MAGAVSAVLLLVASVRVAAQSAAPDSVVYRLSPASRMDVKTGNAGLLGFAGHEHRIRARAFSGRIVYRPQALATSHIDLLISADSLEVLTPPDTAEIRKVAQVMRTDVLDVAHHPDIRFSSSTIVPSDSAGHRVRVSGTLTIVGVSRDVSVELSLHPDADTLRAAGAFQAKQTDFGIRPYRGGPAGTVRVADRLTFELAVVAVRSPP